MKQTEKIAGAYKATTRDLVKEDENGELVLISDGEDDYSDADSHYQADKLDFDELMLDNKLLLNRIDQALEEDIDEDG